MKYSNYYESIEKMKIKYILEIRDNLKDDRNWNYEYYQSIEKARIGAKKYSLKPGILETCLLNRDEEEELVEYYENGKLSIKVA